ncbi:hypothetical protein CKAH01_08664 [Colletotrichum kahawae]|uniref:Uncharacterized protein n=1 Tax=Colletotrichum kahawae TaxID=34407 RepID=A0AAE0CZE8_COLKA|nr:hypothetical protein CKAH01_08664 [Colletotrichum kahawae]
MNFKVLIVAAFAAVAAAGPLGVDPTSESGELTARQCCISKIDVGSSVLESMESISDIDICALA